ncbi:MAG: hypothetical protein QNJ54_10630 [Prochloraceae cyanobacterium]|nr:hypothetical protein [Prochloraceae cyanobacterium]
MHCQKVVEELRSDAGEKSYAQLVEQCKSVEIPQTAARVGFISNSLEEAASQLETAIELLKTQSGEQWEHPQGIYYRQYGIDLKGKVVALFPGQGSQYLEMGRELALNFVTYSHTEFFDYSVGFSTSRLSIPALHLPRRFAPDSTQSAGSFRSRTRARYYIIFTESTIYIKGSPYR